MAGGENSEELIAKLKSENERLQDWVEDLLSGKYVNCVYCGLRYGAVGEVPESKAEILKRHIEQCSLHPMHKLKVESDRLKKSIQRAIEKCEADSNLECFTTEDDTHVDVAHAGRVNGMAEAYGDCAKMLQAALQGKGEDMGTAICQGCEDDHSIPEVEVHHPVNELVGVDGKLYCMKHIDIPFKKMRATVDKIKRTLAEMEE